MPKLKRRRKARGRRATDFVESLDRGLRLLRAFGERAAPMTLSEIARAADLPRATARRILFTLQHGGYVSSDGKLFALTPHVLTLAGAYLRSNQIVAVLQPVLDDISLKALEIISLAVLDGDDVVFIARVEPDAHFHRRRRHRLSPAVVLHGSRPRAARPLGDAELKERLAAMKREALTPRDRDRSEASLPPSPPTASAAIHWSTAKPSRISARSRCRSGATTAPSSPPSISARMSIASRRRRW